MSWDANLEATVDGNKIQLPGCDWNYTHNCNQMIVAVLADAGKNCGATWWTRFREESGDAWWDHLHGKNGKDGAEFLRGVISGLERDPERFIEMNPENKWGSYESLVSVLREMLTKSERYPSATWSISG